jgi:hypothetical protein
MAGTAVVPRAAFVETLSLSRSSRRFRGSQLPSRENTEVAVIVVRMRLKATQNGHSVLSIVAHTIIIGPHSAGRKSLL